jgi:HD superfamily phosphohydrolase
LARKIKIFNDPVHGFIEIPDERYLHLIDHPYFQRLRRIRQLGMASWVYPGGMHTRFGHALGAFHLTGLALEVIKAKGAQITAEEERAVRSAVLLHDLGHGPFSHALEGLLIPGVHHETLTRKLIERIGVDELVLGMFDRTYPRAFFGQLVAGALDMDRMDYLLRDAYYTGVKEGVFGADRIIKTLVLSDDILAVEEKGVLSVEKFLIARRLMYWQVYYHKTCLAAETMLQLVFRRAREIHRSLRQCPPTLAHLLSLPEPAPLDQPTLDVFVETDDADVLYALKLWRHEKDPVLSRLCRMICDRELFKSVRVTHAGGEPPSYFCCYKTVSNAAYPTDEIKILDKSGTLRPFSQMSDLFSTFGQKTSKTYKIFCPTEHVDELREGVF